MTSPNLHVVPDPQEPTDDPATIPAGPEPEPAPFSGVYTMVDGLVVPDPPASTANELPPIIAPWARSRDGRRAVARTTAARWRYVTLFHSLRLPLYWWRLVARSPHGLARIVVGLAVWTADRSVRASLEAMRSGVGGTGLEKLERQHRDNVRVRLGLDAALVVVVLGAVLIWLTVGFLTKTAVAAVVLPIVGFVGRNRERPIVERVIFQGVEVPKLTESLIIQALMNSRIPGVAQAFKAHGDRAIRWIKPPTRTKVGYEVLLDLPGGVTVDDAAAKTGNIASGLSRPTSTVWLSGISEEEGGHEGRLRMVVTDAPLRSGIPPRWPLADPRAGKCDIFAPIPLGVDYLGEPVTIRLMFRSGIIGALPRMGKSFTLRLILLGAALDPTVELHIYDLKGGSDFLSMGEGIPLGSGVAHAFRSGSSADDAAAMLVDLRAMQADMVRRYGVIRRIVKEDLARCPEGKVTRELANDRSLGLHPVILAIDETQVCFADWADAKEFVAIVTDLVKRGPAAGIVTLLATQNVDSSTIPPSISRMASVRFCLRVTDHIATDLILSTGSYRRGLRASELSIDDQGIGYLAGEGDMTKLVRCCFVDGPVASQIVARARKLREATGRLSGLAAGEDTIDTDTAGIVEHLFSVWPQGPKGPEARAHCVTLAERLGEYMPGAYDGITGETVTLSVKAHGIDAKQMKIRGKNTTGISWADLEAVVEARAAAVTKSRAGHHNAPEPDQPDSGADDPDDWDSAADLKPTIDEDGDEFAVGPAPWEIDDIDADDLEVWA